MASQNDTFPYLQFASHNTVVCVVVYVSKPLYCVMQNTNMDGEIIVLTGH